MTIQDKINSYLMNNCKSQKLAKYYAAVSSHQMCCESMLTHVEDGHHWLGICDGLLDSVVDSQEVLYVGFDSCNESQTNMVALMYEKLDSIVLCHRMNDESGGYDLEAYCVFDEKGFFRYLNSLPNFYAYCLEDQYMMNASPEGLALLIELSATS